MKDIREKINNMFEELEKDTEVMPFSITSEFANDLKQRIVKLFDIPVVMCSCETNVTCTKEEDGNGEWKDYCWECRCFRN